MTLFGWNGNSKEENRRVIRLICEWISLHEFRGIIIDLREHRGGNMWPYLEGLSPLIGDSTLLAWGRQKESKKNGTKWINMKKSGRFQSGLYTKKDLPFPIAVLVGKQTASSGEFTALALHGRKRVRLFGEPTAGFTSMNRTFTYKKNTSLHLTTDGVTGYNGKFYNGKMKPIIPDVISQDPMKEARSYILG
jgi:C-terminal processing protease CtpA/Prc